MLRAADRGPGLLTPSGRLGLARFRRALAIGAVGIFGRRRLGRILTGVGDSSEGEEAREQEQRDEQAGQFFHESSS
jgi:hypothetical protein